MNLAQSFYTSLVNDAGITALLGLYQGTPSIHTRVPVPAEAEYPMLVIGGPLGGAHEDFVTGQKPVILRRVMAYGSGADQFRTIEPLIGLVYAKFHLNRFSLSVDGARVSRIYASLPQEAPTSDQNIYGLMTQLEVHLEVL